MSGGARFGGHFRATHNADTATVRLRFQPTQMIQMSDSVRASTHILPVLLNLFFFLSQLLKSVGLYLRSLALVSRNIGCLLALLSVQICLALEEVGVGYRVLGDEDIFGLEHGEGKV